jgi:uncharacterized protein (TIGR02466 family)
MLEIFTVPLFEETLKETKKLNKKMIQEALRLEKNDKGVIKSNQFGFQSERLDPTIPFVVEFFEITKKFITKSLDTFQIQKKPYNVDFSKPWFNINRSKSFNWPHIHLLTECNFSLVYYLKVPKNSGKVVLNNPMYQHNDFFYQDFKLFNKFNSRFFQIVPEESLLIMFPSDLQHSVFPNLSKESRISFAFDIKVS